MTKREKFGLRMLLARNEQKKTLKKVAEETGLSFKAISDWESGKCSNVLMTLPLLAKSLGMTLEELLAVE